MKTKPVSPLPPDAEFGRCLRAAREQAGLLTVTALAHRMGWAVPQAVKLERRVRNPLHGTVRKLVEDAGLPLEAFYSKKAILAAAARLAAQDSPGRN